MKITYDTGFTQMPNNILRSRTLKPLHKVVLSVICSYSNSSNIAFPSYQTIADDSGISRRKVIDIISELVMFGCIKKTERRSSKGDHTANDYEVLIGSPDFLCPVKRLHHRVMNIIHHLMHRLHYRVVKFLHHVVNSVHPINI